MGHTHPLFARLYTALTPYADRSGAAAHRAELLGGLRGRILEVGAGAGANFALYPTSVAEVIAVEPEPYLRERAFNAAAAANVSIRVVAGDAMQLPIATASVDAVVFSLVLCSVPIPGSVLHEAIRVLGDGGELRFYEHVRSNDASMARRQDLLDRIWPYLAGGCHCNRDTERALFLAGFSIASVRRFDFGPSVVAFPMAPHVLGRAVVREANAPT
jgi:SAM-dependent methyltransferase